MSDPVGTPTPKGNRAKNQNRNKRGNANQPSTPGRHGNSRQNESSEMPEAGYQSSAGRLQQQRTGQKAHRSRETSSNPIPPLDGAASPGPRSRPITIQARDENQNRFTTPAKQAYAGPTFHASPAPSSLPIPKFFSKSLPSHTPASAVAEEVHGTGHERDIPPSPYAPLEPPRSGAPVQREASPLDILFNAHRAEQARQKISTSGSPLPQTPQRTLDAVRSPLVTTTKYQQPPPLMRDTSQDNIMKPSNKEMFLMEVDSAETPRDYEAHNTTPFTERIRALHAQGRPPNDGKSPQMDEKQRLAKSLALKQLLKGQGGDISQPHPDSASASAELSHYDHHRMNFIPDVHHGGSDLGHNPSQNQGSSASIQSPPPSDLKAMEANLKKLLKLGT